MEYEDLLPNLVFMFTRFQRFDSNTVSTEFKKRVAYGLLPVRLNKIYPSKFFEVKKISGDLDRLFRMGLLKRKIDTRYFQRKDGKSFGRGYKYLYKISNQGWKYGKYLLVNRGLPYEERPRKGKKPWDMIDEAFLARLKSKVPEDRRPLLEYFYKDDSRESRTKNNRRFPRRYDRRLMDELLQNMLSLSQKTNEADQMRALASRAVQLAEDLTNTNNKTSSPPASSNPSPSSEKTPAAAASSPLSPSWFSVPSQPPPPLSGLQSLLKARNYFSANQINPFIRIDHRTPDSLFALEGDAGITLNELIEWAIRYLIWLGYK